MSEVEPPSELSPDDAFLEAALAEAERTGSTIQNVAARMIASQFHGGQASALYSLASSGAIDLEPLVDEYCEVYLGEDTTEADKQKLHHLGRYVLEYGNRGPVAGWSELWGSL
jgi:hypothetical protein